MSLSCHVQGGCHRRRARTRSRPPLPPLTSQVSPPRLPATAAAGGPAPPPLPPLVHPPLPLQLPAAAAAAPVAVGLARQAPPPLLLPPWPPPVQLL